MAITTLAGAVAGEQQPVVYIKNETGAFGGAWTDLWTDAVNAGTNTTASANGVTYSSSSAQVAGQIYHINPASGNSYISTIKTRSGPTGSFTVSSALFVDRLWQGGTYPATTTASQAITTPTFPARDINGSTNGDGIVLCMVVTTQFTAATTATVTYTNQAGTGSRTATCLIEAVGTKSTGFFGLQSGDTGIQSIQSVRVAAAQAAGAYILIAIRPLALVLPDVGRKTICEDVVTLGMPRLYDGSVPFVIYRGQPANLRMVTAYVETVG